MPRRPAIAPGLAALALACLGVAGCGGSPTVAELPPPTECQKRLRAIGDAYTRATGKAKRPPKSVDELVPFLKDQKVLGKPEDILKSPDDGLPFEIVYGSMLLAMKETGSDMPVVAYERKGKDGRRNVLRGRDETLLMTEGELKSAKFPDGYKFPF